MNFLVLNIFLQFTFPFGIKLYKTQKEPQFFSTTTKDADGNERFMFIVLVYRELTPEQSALFQSTYAYQPVVGQTYYLPVSLCLFSQFPYYSLFREYMGELLRILDQNKDHLSKATNWPGLTVAPSIESELLSHLVNLIFECPAPPPGCTCVRLAVGERILHYSLPGPNDLPLLDVDMRLLFFALSPTNIVHLVRALLLERRVLLFSQHVGLLAPVCYTLLSLCFPFQWPHTLVPVLPLNKLEYVSVPTPYLIGMPSKPLNLGREKDPPVVCDLDTDTVTNAESPDFPDLPKRIKEKLLDKIV